MEKNNGFVPYLFPNLLNLPNLPNLTLIQQATYMLHKLLEHQQERFVTQGGIREQMLHARLNYRKDHPTKSE